VTEASPRAGAAFNVGTILGSTVGGQLAGLPGLRGLFGVCAVGAALGAVVIAIVMSTRRTTAGPSAVLAEPPLR
jgi:predicted MFS family arabinose efflux permease